MKSLGELLTPHHGIKLFMQHYDDDRISPFVEAVLEYCRGVEEKDFNDTGKMSLGEAWLDDRTASLVPAFVGRIVDNTSSNPTTSDTAHVRHVNVDLPFGSIECDLADVHERHPYISTQSTMCEAREYEERLTARDLRRHLRERRFDHEQMKDADRRLVHITNPSPCHMLTLTETATEHQAPAIRDLLGQFVTFQTSMEVRISSEGYCVYQLRNHFPYFAFQETKPEVSHKPGGEKSNRNTWTDLSFLDPRDEPNTCGMYQAQSSFTVSGSDNTRWIAYNLEDTSFNPDREIGDDERDEYQRRDQISMGKFDANLPFTDAREYYLAISLIKAKHARNEIQRVVGRVEASFRNHITCCPFSTASPTEQSAIMKWNEPMLELLAMLIQDLGEKVDCWDSFKESDIDYFADPNATLPSQVIEHIERLKIELDDVYRELRTFGKKLSYFRNSCKELACQLQYRLDLQGGNNSNFTILIISPVVVVSSVFAIDTPVLPFERDVLSFFLSVFAVGSLLWLLLRLKGGWLAQQGWWDRLLRRSRTVRRRRDSSIVTVHEGELSVLRRRNTHADFARNRG
ncbi:hypothetical protein J4E82_003323 [Alternaria postmessia]|jgi:hypothetical protein|uniref:uncharacterized protein n=1 Tax=Alternaria postmessia TaxID=1187938 RepID=UPI0022246CC6|nr:uncharacterized protein J4E82_003323 [Alternaria postmessia]KAI5377943.1 hypothetical protein J4E82_003323 [Alternaria postmessia]